MVSNQEKIDSWSLRSYYDDDYFLKACEGYDTYSEAFSADKLIPRLQRAFELGQVAASDRVLDIGCGRGELLMKSASIGALAIGGDYALAALKIARDRLNEQPPKLQRQTTLLTQDAGTLAFQDNSFSVVFLLEVIEHLTPEEVRKMLSEVHRVLQKGGRFVIHTTPNLWEYKYGYPLLRYKHFLRTGEWLMPETRKELDSEISRKLHINEQSVFGLWRQLLNAGFKAKVWLEPDLSGVPKNTFKEAFWRWFYYESPLKLLFAMNIFAVAIKR
jgi:ubiquinone/menaquinone biosynthesis C-methylase UbiE